MIDGLKVPQLPRRTSMALSHGRPLNDDIVHMIIMLTFVQHDFGFERLYVLADIGGYFIINHEPRFICHLRPWKRGRTQLPGRSSRSAARATGNSPQSLLRRIGSVVGGKDYDPDP